MAIYINGLSSITPQNTFDSDSFLESYIDHQAPYLVAVEPNYKAFIDPKQLRRMSKIIRMGVATSKKALDQAQMSLPDAIITGTGLGCVSDTEKFLNSMLDNKEQLLTPTSFILSTHNTVGAQIAVMLNCHNYNFTYVHSDVSFENALIDALMLFSEGTAKQVLVGGIDEITEENYNTKTNSNLWKTIPQQLSQLFTQPTSGCTPGESATFAALSNQLQEQTFAELIDVETTFELDSSEIENFIISFLKRNQVETNQIDLWIPGINGDPENDKIYHQISEIFKTNSHTISYKNICGEHDSASASAFWLASNILKTKQIPEFVHQKVGQSSEFKYALIYHFNFTHRNNHALMLLRSVK